MNNNNNTNSNSNNNNNNNNNYRNSNNNDMNNNNNNNNKDKSTTTRGILASSKNPATLRRLSQTGDENTNNNEVSWHKRVVVHRVPRSDASRSMFHSKGKESNNSNQCCIIL